jgi:hypothetical protein
MMDNPRGDPIPDDSIRTVKVYQYGSPSKMAPTGEAENQIRLQTRFWNDLVEIDREFGQRYRDITNKADEKVSALNEEVTRRTQEIATLRQTIKDRRRCARSGRVADSGIKERILKLCKENSPLIQELKTYRAEVKLAVKPALYELEGERIARVSQLRQRYAAAGLYWGNYNAVLASYKTARSRAMQSGSELRFHRFDGTGRWTCQIQGGMSMAEAYSGANNLFQLDPVPPAIWSHPAKGERRRLCNSKARLRITSESRNPVWLEIPVVIHRPIPEDARIQRVSISTKKTADRIRWFLNVTVIEEGAGKKSSATGEVLALDVGWRKKVDGAIRVAYWTDSNGQKDEVKLDGSFLSTDRRISSLQETRDGNFNLVRESLSKWL